MPATTSPGVRIENLAAFLADLRRSEAEADRDMTAALRRVGRPIASRASDLAPSRTGRLAAGYTVQVDRATASILNRVPYSGGAEWGQRGKWAGFDRYGATPRFAGRAVEEMQDEIAKTIETEMRAVATIHGWAT